MNVPDLERFGPFFFKILMNVITSNTEEAILTLTSKLSTFKITSIQRENINKTVSQLCRAYRRLVIAKRLIVIYVFHNSLVEEFNSIFKATKDYILIKNHKCDREDILRVAELSYSEMV